MRAFTLLVLAGLVLTACGDPEPTADTTGWPSPDGDWQLQSGVDLVADYPVTMSIEGTEVSGRAACNSYFGAVEVNGSSLSIGQLGSTAMACEPGAMDSERQFLEALDTVVAFRYDNDSLVLATDAADLVFAPVAAAPITDLVGTTWILETLIEGEAATSVAGGPATLLLTDDGNLHASTGCRDLIGRWIESGGTIVVPELAADGECPDELWKQDSLVVTVIGDDFRAAIEGNLLTLSSMGGDGLVYRAEP